MTRLDGLSDDVFVQVLDFGDIPGDEMVTINENATYTVLINARLSHEQQLKALAHAREHIVEKDFEKYDVQSIESDAHRT